MRDHHALGSAQSLESADAREEIPVKISIKHGDSREVLKTLADDSVDAVVTDPPYALVSIAKRFGKAGAAPASGQTPAPKFNARQLFSEELW